MDELTNLKDEELLKGCVPLLVHPQYKFLHELLRRRQAVQIKATCSLNDPVEIYRAQGKVKGYDSILNIPAELSTLK